MIVLHTFGRKHHRTDPTMFDHKWSCMKLPNPYHQGALRQLDGRNPQVQQYVFRKANGEQADTIVQDARRVISQHLHPSNPDAHVDLVVGFYCQGGRHRSVAVAETLYDDLTNRNIPTTIHHWNLNK